MSTQLASGRVMTTSRDAGLAKEVLAGLEAKDTALAIDRPGAGATALPPEIGRLIAQVLDAVASGRQVTISEVPAELTTVTAASILGVSRPTLIKMIRDGRIPAHKVGTHTRLSSEDVFGYLKDQRQRQNEAFDQLSELLDG